MSDSHHPLGSLWHNLATLTHGGRTITLKLRDVSSPEAVQQAICNAFGLDLEQEFMLVDEGSGADCVIDGHLDTGAYRVELQDSAPRTTIALNTNKWGVRLPQLEIGGAMARAPALEAGTTPMTSKTYFKESASNKHKPPILEAGGPLTEVPGLEVGGSLTAEPLLELGEGGRSSTLEMAEDPFSPRPSMPSEGPIVLQPARIQKAAHVKSMAQYDRLHQRSLDDPEGFWRTVASLVSWFKPFGKVAQGGFERGDVQWFLEGKLNVSFNCVDRWVQSQGDKTAILWEGDNPKDVRRISFKQLQQEVARLANALKTLGVKKGTSVCLYMPMVPEAAFAMLACARLGAIHSAVSAGFSADALRDRILDGKCDFILTADQGVREDKKILLKHTVDAALKECKAVPTKAVLVLKHTGGQVAWTEGRDVWWHEAVAKERAGVPCPPVVMDSEDPLFVLGTSGSTGKPKALLHTTGGYLVWAAMTHKYIFDLKPGDIYACMADVGSITGHSYIVYGPLCNGATTFMFESTPMYPDAGRYWEMVERHKINIFYTEPTAIRALMRYGPTFCKRFDRSSLRVLGTVGEPINPEAWQWYFDVVGNGRCSIVDTYLQTETGGVIATALPGCMAMKPGSTALPFMGIEFRVLDPQSGKVLEGKNVEGVLCVARPWPGMARTWARHHQRYLATYMAPYPGFYCTGDGCKRDSDGYYWVTGRLDDMVNISGHQLGSAVIECALESHQSVSECAVVGVPHKAKGQVLFAFVSLKLGVSSGASLLQELRAVVAGQVGSFAAMDEILFTSALPKTHSGKIMRRVLRNIASGHTDTMGDTSALVNLAVVNELIQAVSKMRQ
eukprot:gb/GEZN01002243.1/.p1 GENE.gb/GEZN01002243.1/~~gb/GEZN01002243.1/.p1  ORF type:complete len:853 (+),score=119.30 gb/GEZN01002243.1/:31-2559(+)